MWFLSFDSHGNYTIGDEWVDREIEGLDVLADLEFAHFLEEVHWNCIFGVEIAQMVQEISVVFDISGALAKGCELLG